MVPSICLHVEINVVMVPVIYVPEPQRTWRINDAVRNTITTTLGVYSLGMRPYTHTVHLSLIAIFPLKTVCMHASQSRSPTCSLTVLGFPPTPCGCRLWKISELDMLHQNFLHEPCTSVVIVN